MQPNMSLPPLYPQKTRFHKVRFPTEVPTRARSDSFQKVVLADPPISSDCQTAASYWTEINNC
jgi:hypothetical protein